MCGIVGLFLKNQELEGTLGHRLEPMLLEMTERGPDSAGIAIYRNGAAPGETKFTLFNADPGFDWSGLEFAMRCELQAEVRYRLNGNHAVFTLSADPERTIEWLRDERPEVRLVSVGHRIELYKDVGTPAEVADSFALDAMDGSHGIGHTRMATESGVTTAHSHPFWAGLDLCLVHNGTISNYHGLRDWLKRRGLHFESDNDSEVAAKYLAYRIAEGATLKQALEAGLKDLDGFYTFCVGTGDGFAVMRDPFACKPAVIAETDDWVAMASEFRSLAKLPGIDAATVWEPRPETVYAWHREGRA
ncbi:MAG: glutamine amidotransferase family protein [Alphaproteobacteria bacterium]